MIMNIFPTHNPNEYETMVFVEIPWVQWYFAVQLILQTALNTDFDVFINSWPPLITAG